MFRGARIVRLTRYRRWSAPTIPFCSFRATGRSACRIVGGLVELAVQRRAADLQPARDFRHLSAIVRDRETDDFAFHLLERTDFSRAGQHGQGAAAWEGSDGYFNTRNHRGRH